MKKFIKKLVVTSMAAVFALSPAAAAYAESIPEEDGAYVYEDVYEEGGSDVCDEQFFEDEEFEEEAISEEFSDQVATIDLSDDVIDEDEFNAQIAAALDAALGDRLEEEKTKDGKYVIVIDPYGDDVHTAPGYDINLKIGQYLVAELQSYDSDYFTFVSTRNSKSCPAGGADCNAKRIQKAVEVNADLVISLRMASNKKSSVNGANIIYPNNNGNPTTAKKAQEAAKQAETMLKKVGLDVNSNSAVNSTTAKYPDGTKGDADSILRGCKDNNIPCIIIQHGYTTGKIDKQIFAKESNIEAVGAADAIAIANYFNLPKEKIVNADRTKVEAFVKRLYSKALNRTGEADGVKNWTDKLCNGELDGSHCAEGFFFSQEFINRNLSDEDFVETLYNVLMDRPSDAGGKKDWVYKLQNGVGREGVFRGFTESIEFDAICNNYGIKRGRYVVYGRNRNPGLTTYISRLYTKALGRPYDVDGLNYWCDEILDERWTVDDASTTGFFHSKEFLNKKISNEEYVTILYYTFFDREPDTAGFNDWIGRLKKGATRDDVLKGFAASAEFANLKKSYGIQ